jgi:DNA-binding FadR family transcriptional regulator
MSEQNAGTTHVVAPRPSPKAYEEVANTLLGRIARGQLRDGDRLPGEIGLAAEFGVSRATIREALRLLSAQDLIRTAKGAGGGSFIRVPRVDRINEFLVSSIDLMTGAEHVTIDDLLEAREVLEVPAARLAAARRTDEDLERLRDAIPAEPTKLASEEQFLQNREFHSIVLHACGNNLLSIAAQPVFGVLMANVARGTFGTKFNKYVSDQHAGITRAIAAGESASAGDLMHEHREFLRPVYEKAWHRTTRRKP